MRECGFGAYVVGQDHHAATTALHADPGVAGTVVVSAFVEAATLLNFEYDNAQTGRQIRSVLRWWE